MSLLDDKKPRPTFLGIIKSGKKNASGNPVNTAHLVFPKQGERGHDLIPADWHDTKTTLDIRFTSNDVQHVTGLAMRKQTGWGWQCIGDGQAGKWRDNLQAPVKPRKPCAKGGCSFAGKDCKESIVLRFDITDLPIEGEWIFQTASVFSVDQITGALLQASSDYGGIMHLPWQLYKVRTNATVNGKRTKIWVVNIRIVRPEVRETVANALPAGSGVTTGCAPVADRQASLTKLEAVMRVVFGDIGQGSKPSDQQRNALTLAFRALVRGAVDRTEVADDLTDEELAAFAEMLTAAALRTEYDKQLKQLQERAEA